MSHSGHLLVTQLFMEQVCPGDSGLYALLKCERNQLPSENRQVDGQGERAKSEIPECLANQRYGMTAGPVLNYALHDFVSQTSAMVHI